MTFMTFAGDYVFDGTILQQGTTDNAGQPDGWIVTNFHLVDRRSFTYTASSLQLQQVGDKKTLVCLD